MKEQSPLRFKGRHTRKADGRSFDYQLELYPWQIRASVFEGDVAVFEGLKIETFVYGVVLTDSAKELQARQWIHDRIDSGEGFI